MTRGYFFCDTRRFLAKLGEVATQSDAEILQSDAEAVI